MPRPTASSAPCAAPSRPCRRRSSAARADGRDDHAFPVDREDVDYIEELCLLVLRAVAVRRAEAEDEAGRAIARAVESRESRGAFL